MKAKVQYNDFVGTAAADVSDYYLNSINEFLKNRFPDFDWSRYYCLGCEFYTSYGQYPSVSFICRDLVESKIHLLKPETEFTLVEFFELFKRFSIIIGEGIDSIEVEDDDAIVIKNSDTRP